MSEPVTLRWEEFEWYDIARDRESLRLMAITSVGTWYTDVPSGRRVRELRPAFRERVQEAIALGERPGCVDMDEVRA